MAIFKKKGDLENITPPGELEELRSTAENAGLPHYVEEIVFKEIEKLSKTSPTATEYTIGTNYIDYLLALPWHKKTVDKHDLKKAEEILNQEHYGLNEIKDRILEHLAVRILKQSHQPKILVVDDEKVTRMNLEHVLVKEGYEVLLASNGKEAIELLDRHKFNIIITDYKMDQMDGLKVLEYARQKESPPEVIMITGYANVPNAVEAMRKGSFHYISKPFKLNEIRSTVKSALAAQRFQFKSKGPILCFAGPPGTGKTSLGESIAHSLGKKFIRVSVAGIKDEAEIRGHRRSYVGALPGRVIQEIRRSESNNPVFVLDELDKIGKDFKGDPAAALLEVLDPEQNSHFIDHYLDLPFDLSNVMFIATANMVDMIPGPLLDRLEVLHLSGYTEEEKEQIAFRHLIPRSIHDAGLENYGISFTPEAVRMIIREYTREAGLRNFQRKIDSICRKTARGLLTESDKYKNLQINPETVRTCLGPRKYYVEVAETGNAVGIATALAWTETGGEIIFVEAIMMKGRSNLILTGSLGDVMKESAQAALSYIRSNTETLKIEDTFFDEIDIHIHVPAGAIPKDGPSAGLTIAVSLLSLITRKPARQDIALSGEITLSGRILPVGGVREKVLAARRAGIKTIILPSQNASDVSIIPDIVKQELEIILADHLDNIIGVVF